MTNAALAAQLAVALAQGLEGDSELVKSLSESLGAISAPLTDNKASKEEAHYREAAGNQRCEHCVHFASRSQTCEKVAGEILPTMLCDYYQSRTVDVIAMKVSKTTQYD